MINRREALTALALAPLTPSVLTASLKTEKPAEKPMASIGRFARIVHLPLRSALLFQHIDDTKVLIKAVNTPLSVSLKQKSFHGEKTGEFEITDLLLDKTRCFRVDLRQILQHIHMHGLTVYDRSNPCCLKTQWSVSIFNGDDVVDVVGFIERDDEVTMVKIV